MWDRICQRTLGSEIPAVQHGEWLRWLISAFGFWLLVATRPLWLNRGDFPQIPWFEWGCTVPHAVDSCLLLGVIGSLISIGVTRSESNANCGSLLLFAACLTGLMLLDQHRSQPWAYQLVLTAIVLALTPFRRAIGLLRLLTISIYVHSAISKCDASFCTGIGRSFLLALSHLIQGPTPVEVAWQASAWPLLFPLGELLIAIGLIWPRSRRWALWGAIGMHLLLLLVLGPWGLRHSSGVLIWNLYFIAQDWILFATGRSNADSQLTGTPDVSALSRRFSPAATMLIAWSVVWPCLEPFGYCDLWPAWGLYAQHGEQLTVKFSNRALRQLPTHWQETAMLSGEWKNGEPLWQLRPQSASLQTVSAPLYPQNRFVLGVILAVRDSQLSVEDVSATWLFPANRWTGTRQSRHLANLREIEVAVSECRFNGLSRD